MLAKISTPPLPRILNVSGNHEIIIRGWGCTHQPDQHYDGDADYPHRTGMWIQPPNVRPTVNRKLHDVNHLRNCPTYIHNSFWPVIPILRPELGALMKEIYLYDVQLKTQVRFTQLVYTVLDVPLRIILI